MTKQISLTQSLFATVDDEDYEFLNQWRWYAEKSGNNFYAGRNGKLPFQKKVKMHRVVMNAPESMEVDHINGDGLDNRRENLRLCTRIENMRNRKKNINNSSGYKGVDRNKNKWRAYIFFNGKQTHLGYFQAAEDAARAYDKAAKELYGEFANTNF